MKIKEVAITKELLEQYKNELFLFNESIEYLKENNKILLLEENGQVVGISMITPKMDKEYCEDFLSTYEYKYIKDLMLRVYIDSVYAIKKGYNVLNSVINYIKEKYNKNVWLYSTCDKVKYYSSKPYMKYLGDNIFISY